MAVQVQRGLVHVLRHLARWVAAVAVAEQLPPFDDVAPVVLAGVVHEQHHLRQVGDGVQHLQRLARQRRDAEHHHPARQVLRTLLRRQRLGPLQELLVDVGAASLRGRAVRLRLRGLPVDARRDVAFQAAPQRRLPALFGRHRGSAAVGADQLVVVRLPGLQPIGPIHLVLVIQVGEALGQLVAPAGVRIGRQKSPQRGEAVGIDRLLAAPQRIQVAQQAIQAPGHRRLVERGAVRQHLQHAAIHPPNEARRQRHIDRRGNPATAAQRIPRIGRQGQLQPLADAVALHQNHFVFERMQRMTLHPGGHQAAQGLQSVALQQHEARRPIIHALRVLLHRVSPIANPLRCLRPVWRIMPAEDWFDPRMAVANPRTPLLPLAGRQ